jgi:3-oxoacyl-[acyl-carrier-protein] synthase II
MEMQAFTTIFKGRKLPVYSLKGGIGHTMGAAGLVEMIIAQRAMSERCVPPTVNLGEAGADALGWVSAGRQGIGTGTLALVTNAGFGGVNTALVLADGVPVI